MKYISKCSFHSNAINIVITGCTYYNRKDRIDLVVELNGGNSPCLCVAEFSEMHFYLFISAYNNMVVQ